MIKQKVFEIRNSIGKLKKNKENPFYNSQYMDINDLLDELQPLLETNKILLTQPIIEGSVISKLECLESGETMVSEIHLPELNDPQKLGSAITYFRRYTLKSLLAISEEDDDANKTVKSEKSPDDDKAWLNATDKAGNLNKRGEQTALKLANKEITWKVIHDSFKVSKKDKSAIEGRVSEI